MTETEVKIQWEGSAEDAEALIESRGYHARDARVLEIDQLFDQPSGDLRAAGLVLRLRRAGTLAKVTYKGRASRDIYKSREEIEFEVSDPGAFHTVLERLGYQAAFRYEKYRTEFSDPAEPGLVTLDETPLGIFLELEGAEDWIDRAAVRLGFSKADYLTESYYSLYQTHRQTHAEAPPDMTFGLREPIESNKTTLEGPKSIASPKAR